MTLPLVIGIGVTNGIHILNRFAEEQHPSILARSTGKAVLVSGLTAIAGFGSLMLAAAPRHRQPRTSDVHGHHHLHDRGPHVSAGSAEYDDALPREKKTTQCRQCTVDTGSGGTEVKTSSMPNIKRVTADEVNPNVKNMDFVGQRASDNVNECVGTLIYYLQRTPFKPKMSEKSLKLWNCGLFRRMDPISSGISGSLSTRHTHP